MSRLALMADDDFQRQFDEAVTARERRRPTYAETWPLRDPPPPTPGSLSDQWEKRQNELRRREANRLAAWENEVAMIHDLARRDQQHRRADHTRSTEYADAVATIEIDEKELTALDHQRADLIAALRDIDSQRRPVVARLEANREVESRFSEERWPIPETPPRPGSGPSPSPFVGHGGYVGRYGFDAAR